MYVTPQTLAEGFPDGLIGLAFDCDGVMFDTRDCNIRFYNLILERMGLPPMAPAQEDFVHFATVQASLEYIIPRSRWAEIPIVRKSVDYVAEIMPLMRPEPGLMELLATLQTLHIRMAVYTNRTNTMELTLDRWGMTSYFFPVITAAVVRGKPHPEGAFRILEAWGAKPGQIAFIGDSTADQGAAQGAGVPFWAFKNETLAADRHIPDFWSLRQAILQWKGHP